MRWIIYNISEGLSMYEHRRIILMQGVHDGLQFIFSSKVLAISGFMIVWVFKMKLTSFAVSVWCPYFWSKIPQTARQNQIWWQISSVNDLSSLAFTEKKQARQRNEKFLPFHVVQNSIANPATLEQSKHSTFVSCQSFPRFSRVIRSYPSRFVILERQKPHVNSRKQNAATRPTPITTDAKGGGRVTLLLLNTTTTASWF